MASDPIVESSRRSRDLLLSALRDAGANVSHPSSIRCPFHEDKAPSAGIFCDDGVWRFKCHASCCGVNYDMWDIRARMSNRTPGEEIAKAIVDRRERDPSAGPAPRRHATLDDLAASFSNVERVHRYANPDEPGRSDLVVIRWREVPDGPKRFVQCHETRDGMFVAKAPEKPWPIYNRIRVRDADTVVFVEGEKCVEALAQLGIVATTSPGGAGKAEHCDLSPLAGKRVVLWPDNDPPDERTRRRTGIEHMRDVQRRLESLSPKPRISWLDPDGLSLPPKGDAADLVADAVARFGDEAGSVVRETIATAEPIGARSELRELLDATISGRRRCIPLPWPELDRHSRAMLPGTITLLCGDPGSSKSFMALSCLVRWLGDGVRATALMLEETRAWHLSRVLAMLSSDSSLLDPEWIRNNGGEVRRLEEEHSGTLDAVGEAMRSPPRTENTTQADVVAWVEEQVASNVEVAIVDPASLAAREGKPWEADSSFVASLLGAVSESNTRLLLVTHPRTSTGTSGVAIDGISGGAAYQRFSQTILWLHGAKPGEPVHVSRTTSMGTLRDEVVPDRIVRVLKARNGPGQGLSVAFGFDKRTLGFSEMGTMAPRKGAGA